MKIKTAPGINNKGEKGHFAIVREIFDTFPIVWGRTPGEAATKCKAFLEKRGWWKEPGHPSVFPCRAPKRSKS